MPAVIPPIPAFRSPALSTPAQWMGAGPPGLPITEDWLLTGQSAS
jgi:hypothetical protein